LVACLPQLQPLGAVLSAIFQRFFCNALASRGGVKQLHGLGRSEYRCLAARI